MRLAESLILLQLIAFNCEAASWNYDLMDSENGPYYWGATCSSGKRQSPIDFPDSGLERSILPKLEFEHYDTAPESIAISNNGHTAKITFTMASGGDPPLMSGGGLQTSYRLAQIHFHWGSLDNTGSEHMVANRSFPLEMHLVHYKNEYHDIMAALTDGAENSLAVLGVFFKLSEQDNPSLAPIIDGLKAIHDYHQKTSISAFPMESILPEDLSRFYRYNGSLTTPDCNEIVTWTVVQNPVDISLEQLKQFRQLNDKPGNPLVDNYRPVQKINSRRVLDVSTFSDNDNNSVEGQAMSFASLLPLLLHVTSMAFF